MRLLEVKWALMINLIFMKFAVLIRPLFRMLGVDVTSLINANALWSMIAMKTLEKDIDWETLNLSNTKFWIFGNSLKQETQDK